MIKQKKRKIEIWRKKTLLEPCVGYFCIFVHLTGLKHTFDESNLTLMNRPTYCPFIWALYIKQDDILFCSTHVIMFYNRVKAT
jgi:hypothetical protein